MELLLAGAAGHLGQGVIGAMDDTEADHAVLKASKVLIQVTLPECQPIQY